jgi:GTP-binding protein YchF
LGFKCGIVGLPNVGKSTIFNALSKASVPAENYPFCTIEPHVGVVAVPDTRLEDIRHIFGSEKATPSFIEFVDIAGLVKGASKGEGLGNKFLSHIRPMDAIVHVVRCFEDNNVTHVEGSLDPIRDIEIVELELILADLEVIERNRQKLEKMVKSGETKLKEELNALDKAYDALIKCMPLRKVDFMDREKEYLRPYQPITLKPVIYVANTNEYGLDNEYVKRVKKYAEREGSVCIVMCGKLEVELLELDENERREFLESIGLKESTLDTLIKAGYRILDLITFFTANEKEARAWAIKRGTTVYEASGKIHTDMQRGFIKAEVINYNDLVKVGNYHKAKELGQVRIEGKDYVLKDGDVVYIRFKA